MSSTRKRYPSDVSDDEWSLVVPYLTLVREDAVQRQHALRELFNGLRYVVRYGIAWRAMPNDLPPWHAVYQQTQRWMQAGCFEALAQDRHARPSARPACHARRSRRPGGSRATCRCHPGGNRGERQDRLRRDQGYTGERPAAAAEQHGIALEVVKLPEAKRGFVLLPRRWVVV